MPKGKRPQRTPWLFRDKPVVAHAIKHQYCDRFSVSIRYEEPTNQGSITLHHVVHVDGFASVQSLSLVLRPENIVECMLSDKCNLPVDVLRLIPEVSSGVIALSLTLHQPGTVLCPVAPLPLPIAEGELRNKQFAAFSRLCQTNNVRLYFGKNQLQPEQLGRLQKFVSALSNPERDVCANHIDLRCLGGGRGAQETSWCYLHPQSVVAELLKATNDLEPAQATSGADSVDDDSHAFQRKRAHSPTSSPAPPAKSQKLWYDVPPLGSPTEVNTPSTHPATPETGTRTIPPRHKTPAVTSTKRDTPSTRENIPLPAYTVENTFSPAFLHSSTSSLKPSPSIIKPTLFKTPHQPQSDLPTLLASLLQETLPPLLTQTFTTILGPILNTHIQTLITSTLEQQLSTQLPPLTHKILQQNLDTYLNNLEEAQKTAQLEIDETVEEAKTELLGVKEQGIRDIEEFADEQVNVVEGQVEEVLGDAVTRLEDRGRTLEGRLDDKYRRIGKGEQGSRRRKSI